MHIDIIVGDIVAILLKAAALDQRRGALQLDAMIKAIGERAVEQRGRALVDIHVAVPVDGTPRPERRALARIADADSLEQGRACVGALMEEDSLPAIIAALAAARQQDRARRGVGDERARLAVGGDAEPGVTVELDRVARVEGQDRARWARHGHRAVDVIEGDALLPPAAVLGQRAAHHMHSAVAHAIITHAIHGGDAEPDGVQVARAKEILGDRGQRRLVAEDIIVAVARAVGVKGVADDGGTRPLYLDAVHQAVGDRAVLQRGVDVIEVDIGGPVAAVPLHRVQPTIADIYRLEHGAADVAGGIQEETRPADTSRGRCPPAASA